MYCPECNSEYREGFTACAECQIPLIEGTPPEEAAEDSDEGPGLHVLLETSHPTSLDPMIVRLEESGVPYIMQSGTALSMLEGLMSETLPEDWRAVVLVPAEHLEAARRIAAETSHQQVTSPIEDEE